MAFRPLEQRDINLLTYLFTYFKYGSLHNTHFTAKCGEEFTTFTLLGVCVVQVQVALSFVLEAKSTLNSHQLRQAALVLLQLLGVTLTTDMYNNYVTYLRSAMCRHRYREVLEPVGGGG